MSELRQRIKEQAHRSNRGRRDYKLAWERDHRPECACGRPMNRKSRRCRTCENQRQAQRVAERTRVIEQMWQEGASNLTGLRWGSVIFGKAPAGVGGVAASSLPGWHTKGSAAAGHHTTPLFSWAASLRNAFRIGRRQPLPEHESFAPSSARGSREAADLPPELGRRPASTTTFPGERLHPSVEARYRIPGTGRTR